MLIINKYSCYRLWLSLLHLDTPISFKCSCVLVDNTNHTKSTTTFGSSPNRLCFPTQQSFILLLSYWLSVFFFLRSLLQNQQPLCQSYSPVCYGLLSRKRYAKLFASHCKILAFIQILYSNKIMLQ